MEIVLYLVFVQMNGIILLILIIVILNVQLIQSLMEMHVIILLLLIFMKLIQSKDMYQICLLLTILSQHYFHLIMKRKFIDLLLHLHKKHLSANAAKHKSSTIVFFKVI